MHRSRRKIPTRSYDSLRSETRQLGACQILLDPSMSVAVLSLNETQNEADAPQERRLANPPHNLPEPWDGIALRHCACVAALYRNSYQEASVQTCVCSA